jgi:DNA-binding CsgD family transcriptional regulator
VSDALTEGRAAFAREAWSEARARLAEADAITPLGHADLDRLATAAHLTGRDEEAAAARTRAYDVCLARGETIPAARQAFWLAFAIIDKPARQAQAGGWLARARRLVDEAGADCAERGLLLSASAFQHVMAGDAAAAHAEFREAAEIGARFRDRDVLALARHGMGRSLLRMNRRAEGLALLDEVMVDVSRGDVAPTVAGVVYCSLIGACHELFDWRRAQEWTEALAGWCDAHPDMVPFRGSCLVRRSEVMQLRGSWDAAMREAEHACARLSDQQPEFGAACYQLAELCRVRGAFEQAEMCYRRASQAGVRLLAGLALLRLAQGQTPAALAAVRRALEETRDRRGRALVLRAAVDIFLAAGDRPGAVAAADELARLSAELDAPFLDAAVAAALGAVALDAGEIVAALGRLSDAETAWQRLDAPYEAARVRVLIGIAYRQIDDRDGAAMQFDAALDTFERLGAAPDVTRTTALAAVAAAPAPASNAGLTGREVEVLRLVATGRTNRAIAAELRISEKTVARHLSNIFVKLDLSSRAAATAYAYEHKLI